MSKRSRDQARKPTARLAAIRRIFDDVDRRCLASDGPVSRFQDEVTDAELRRIYWLTQFRVPR